ncbi:MAG: hypothetical protein IKQ68_03165 [Prevotella sp.]|nr:hypothetical protein [Prevotella sp.]
MKWIVKMVKHDVVKLAVPLVVLATLFVMGLSAVTNHERVDFCQLENRFGNEYPEWEDSLWLSGEWQRQTTDAVSDRLPFVKGVKSSFFWLRNGLLFAMQKRMYSFTDYYVHFRRDVFFYGDKEDFSLLYCAKPLSDKRQSIMQTMAGKINSEASGNPGVGFYLYYVTKDDDMRFDNGRVYDYFGQLCSLTNLPETHVDRLKVRDFSTFRRFFYRTDHHWQCFGSYQGYKDIFRLLGLDEQGERLNEPVADPDSTLGVPDDSPPVLANGEPRPVLVSRMYHGSKCNVTGTAGKFQCKMYAYQFNYSPMKITVDGKPSKYGNEDFYLHNKNVSEEFEISYGKMYGDDIGELIFSTGRSDRPNILVIGNSYDNPLLKLIAGHYNTLYSIDLRWYEKQKGNPFCMDDYIRRHNITTVLFVGSGTMYYSSDFLNF